MKGFAITDLSWQVSTAAQPILQELNLSLEPGAFYVILGPNGAGKSSLLRLLLGFITPTTGHISYNAQPLCAYSRRALARQIAYLPQSSSADLVLPVRDVIAMARFPWLPRFAALGAEDLRAIAEAVEHCACTALLERDFATLSGGERQRVLCCRALAQGTPWIVLDEPAASLDLRVQHELLALLAQQQKTANKTIICVLHDLNLAWRYADQIIMLRAGKLEQVGAKQAVMTEAILSDLYALPIQALAGRNAEERLFFPLLP